MSEGLWITIAAGAVATAASVAAWTDAQRLKRREGGRRWPLAVFWTTIASYCACFTMMRVAHAFDGPTLIWYHGATIAGATSAASLFYILAGVVWGPRAMRTGAEVGGGTALVTLTLVFALGVLGPRITPDSIEYIPASTFARIAIGVAYIGAPVVLSFLVLWASGRDPGLARRMSWFAGAVVLMYVPNALRYVVFVEGVASVVAAAVMAVGTILGWRSYSV